MFTLLFRLLKLIEDVKAKSISITIAKPESAQSKKLSREPSREELQKPQLKTQIPTEFTDPPGIKEEVIRLFDEWLTIYTQTSQNDNHKAASTHIAQMQQGILKDEESSSRFFRICTEVAVESCVIDKTGNLNYVAVDGFSKLVVLMVKFSENPNTKITLLSRVLGVVVRVLIRDYDLKKTKFNQRTYFRLFANWLVELNYPDSNLDTINLQILLAFRYSLDVLY